MATTRRYTIHGLQVESHGDLWQIPCLRDNGQGILSPDVALFRVSEGRLCDPMSHHPASELPDDCVYQLEAGEPLKGWGKRSCDYSYRVGSCVIPGPLLDKIAEHVPIEMPIA